MNIHRKFILIATGCAAISLFIPAFAFRLRLFEELKLEDRGQTLFEGGNWLALPVILLPGFLAAFGKREQPLPRWASAATMIHATFFVFNSLVIICEPFFKTLVGVWVFGASEVALFILGILAWRQPKPQIVQ